jgi:hypothetical protein
MAISILLIHYKLATQVYLFGEDNSRRRNTNNMDICLEFYSWWNLRIGFFYFTVAFMWEDYDTLSSCFMVFLDTPLKVKLFYFIPSRLHLIWLFISFTILVGRSLLYYEDFILKWIISSSKDLKVCELIGGGLGEVHFRNL